MWIRIRDLFDPGSGMEIIGSGIRDKHPAYATLVKYNRKYLFNKTHFTFSEEQQNLLAFASKERLPRTLDSKGKRNSDAAAKAMDLA
jgi:hypothetical protein